MAQIKISANTTEFRRSIMDLGRLVKGTMGKTSITLFDAETKKLLAGEAEGQINKLNVRINRLNALISSYARKSKEAAGNAKLELEYRQKMVQATDRLVQAQKQRGQLGEALQGLKGGGGFLGGLGKGLAGIPGIGGLMRGMGLGPMGMLGLGLGGAAVGAGAYGYSRLSAGYDRYSETLDTRLRLRGRGVRDVDMNAPLRGQFAGLGVNEGELQQARLQGVEMFGRGGTTQEQMLQRARFARGAGLDLQQLQGFAAPMRAQVGKEGATRDFLKLQASMLAAGIEEEVGPYLETAVGLLTDIRENGLVDTDQLLSALAGFTRQGVSPERSSMLLRGLQGAVQGSTGEANAFFQAAFGKAGIGGRTLGGIQGAISTGGVFGLNLEDYKGMSERDRRMFRGMGFEKGFQKRTGAIKGMLEQTFGGAQDEQSRLSMFRFMTQTGMSKNVADAAEMFGLLEKGETDPTKLKEFEKRLQENQLSTEEKMLKNLEDIKTSQDGQLDNVKTLREITEYALGKTVAPTVVQIQGTLLHIDEIILKLYNGIARIIPGMETADTAMNQAMTGERTMTRGQVEEIYQREGRGGVFQAAGRMGAEEYDLRKEIQGFQDAKARESKMGNVGMVSSYDQMISSLQKRLDALVESQKRMVDHVVEQTKVQRTIADSTHKTAKGVSRPATNAQASGKVD